MALSAVFGITNDGLNLVVNLLLLFLVVVWLALVYWTYADARRRIQDPMLVTSAMLASLFPFVGTVVYMIVRPPEYLEDVHERELEIAAAEARLAMVAQESCPYCHHEVEKAFLRCPHCLRRLKEPCGTCGKPLDSRWRICPYCEAEVADAAPAQARRRAPRRERAPGGESKESKSRSQTRPPTRTKAAEPTADAGLEQTSRLPSAPADVDDAAADRPSTRRARP